jgi:integrase
MIYSEELLAVAKRIFWFGTPEEALEFPKRFLTYAMTTASTFVSCGSCAW